MLNDHLLKSAASLNPRSTDWCQYLSDPELLAKLELSEKLDRAMKVAAAEPERGGRVLPFLRRPPGSLLAIAALRLLAVSPGLL